MKKMISLLLALILALGMTPVFAEEAADAPDTDAIYWANLYPEVEALGLAGEYFTLDGLQVAFWLPASLHQTELKENVEEAHAVAVFETENGNNAFLISLYPLEVETLAGFAEAVAGVDGAQECRALTINGLSAYSFEADDCLFVSFFVDGGYVLSFNFSPVSNDAYNALARIIASSVQPYSGAEE